MSQLYRILSPVKSEAENGIKTYYQQHPFQAIAIDYMLPLYVNFISDNGLCSLMVQKGGKVLLNEGPHRCPDITVKSTCSTLLTLINEKNEARFNQAERNGQIQMAHHTSKGQQALIQVRSFFT
jgi:hypothetical protein